MTEHQTMNTIIHAAFRRDLLRFDTALKTPSLSPSRAAQLASAWDNFAFQLHHHHQDEETIFWPVLLALGAPASLTGDLDGEHAQMLEALNLSEAAMQIFREKADKDSANQARTAIGSLSRVLLDHLEHEERDMEPISAEHHASAQIKAAQKRVRVAHRGNQGTLFAWLLDGADADAIRGLRREVPRPILAVITRTAGRRYRRTIAPTWA